MRPAAESGVLGGLPLGLAEVGGDGDDGNLDLCTEISLSSLSFKNGVGKVNGDQNRFSIYYGKLIEKLERSFFDP